MLLTEKLFDTSVETITEGTEKNLYISGVFLQSDVVNRNRRIYPDRVLAPAVEQFVETYVNTRRAVGELEHPETSTIGIDRVSHLITEVSKEGSNYYGKAKVLGTPMGNLLRSLLEGGVQMGVSSRGNGSTRKLREGVSEVDKYKLYTVDAVYAPSAPDAFVDTIVESTDLAKVFQDKFLEEFEQFLEARRIIKESKAGVRHQVAVQQFEQLLKTFNGVN